MTCDKSSMTSCCIADSLIKQCISRPGKCGYETFSNENIDRKILGAADGFERRHHATCKQAKEQPEMKPTRIISQRKPIMVPKEEEIRSRYEKVGQGHVLKHFNKLTTDEKDALLAQLDSIAVENIADLLKSALSDQQAISESSNEGSAIQPFSDNVGRSIDSAMMERSTELGMEAIRNGEVAALVLSGGQGTRLGFAGPKGMYDIGLPSNKTLFRLLVERIAKLDQLAAGTNASKSAKGSSKVPLYVMTSPVNHEDTVKYFEESSFFGLSTDSVKFFQQGMLPCLTEDGKIIMEKANEVAMAPDGNGGIYPSLVASGMLDDMTKRGVRYLHVFSIDNAMTKPADPAFIGYCISKGANFMCENSKENVAKDVLTRGCCVAIHDRQNTVNSFC